LVLDYLGIGDVNGKSVETDRDIATKLRWRWTTGQVNLMAADHIKEA